MITTAKFAEIIALGLARQRIIMKSLPKPEQQPSALYIDGVIDFYQLAKFILSQIEADNLEAKNNVQQK